MRSIIFAISFLFRKGQMRRVNNFSRNTSVRISACFIKRVEFYASKCMESREKKDREGEREGERKGRLSYTTCYWHRPNFTREHVGIGNPLYRGTVFTSPAAGYRRRSPASLKFNDGAENIHSPRARGNKWFTLATSGRRRNEDGRGGRGEGGRTRFKHIRERWCLKNNHAEGGENGRREAKVRDRESRSRGREGKRGWRFGVDDWGHKFLRCGGGRYRFNCNYFGITAG